MADFIIKNIPDEKMRQFKTACAYFKESMTEVLIRLMEVQIAAHQVDIAQAIRKRLQPKKKRIKE